MATETGAAAAVAQAMLERGGGERRPTGAHETSELGFNEQAIKKEMEEKPSTAQTLRHKFPGLVLGDAVSCVCSSGVAAQTGAHRGICRQRSSNEAAESRQGTAGDIEKPRK